METVAISKFKATCLELLKKVQKTGQPILVTRMGEPIAQVVPPDLPQNKRDWLGSAEGTGKIIGDVVTPLDSDMWEVMSDLRKKP